MKPNSKIKFKLFNWRNRVCFQVMEMDERFRANTSDGLQFSTDNFTICSKSYPELLSNEIYLHGQDRSEDCFKVFYDFPYEGDAIEYIKKAKAALKDWAENWEGFKEKTTKETEETLDNDIFEY